LDRTRPALDTITDNKIQIATIIAKYGAVGVGAGGGIGIGIAIVGKALGAW